MLKGIQGLLASTKGTLCLIVFFCTLAADTYLCAAGKMDGTAYGVCLSAVTSALVAVFCYTRAKTDQAYAGQ